MATDKALIEKREELKRQLSAGEYKTLIDIFLEWCDRMLRKLTGRPKPLPTWLLTFVVMLAVNGIGFGAISVANDLKSIRELGGLLGVGNPFGVGFLLRLLVTVLSIATVTILNRALGRIFSLWRNHILDATETIQSLTRFEDWLKKTCNVRSHLLVTILGGLFVSSFVVYINSSLINSYIGFGFTFDVILTDFFIAAFCYQILMIILLPVLLHSYDLKLFESDPSNSEVVARLSGELGYFVQLIAVYAAIITLANFIFGMLQAGGIFVVLALWLPIIAMFTENHASLASVIRRVKWRTLNDVQARIAKLRASRNFGSPKTMDAINKLMNYHDRVLATRNSALDVRAYLGFVNSLLLPLLAFILGNLDLVFNLVARKP